MRHSVTLPTDLAGACRAIAERPEYLIVAGGTDIMVPVNDGRIDPPGWIGLRHIDEIGRIDGLSIGAGVTFSTIERTMGRVVPALVEAARTVGSPQIRNAATLGGNVATASPAGDSLPVLVCYDALVELVSVRGSRSLRLTDYLVGPKRTAQAPDELIAAIHLQHVSGAQAFAKVGLRNAMTIAVCSLAVRLDRDAGHARVALGSVGPVVIRAEHAERLLIERAPVGEFADAVADASQPIDDHRSTAAYRRHAVRVLATRMHAWVHGSSPRGPGLHPPASDDVRGPSTGGGGTHG